MFVLLNGVAVVIEREQGAIQRDRVETAVLPSLRIRGRDL
jgi:hypothetical protein